MGEVEGVRLAWNPSPAGAWDCGLVCERASKAVTTKALAGGDGEGLGANGRGVRTGAGLAHGFESLRGAEKLRGVDVSDFTAGREGDGDSAGRDFLREFGDSEDVVGIHGEEGRMDFSTERFNGCPAGLATLLGVLKPAGPSVLGITDLGTKMGPEWLFPGEGLSRGWA